MKRKILITLTTVSLLFTINMKSFADEIKNTQTNISNEQSVTSGYINTISVNFRKEPSLDSSVYYTLDKMDKVDIIEKEGDWAKIRKDEKTGYVYTKYVSEKKDDIEVSSMSLENSNKMNVKATAYAGDVITSTGTVPKWGTIAVDPTIIPYGTKVYIPKFDKVFIAEDTGSAIKGNKIDIFMDTQDDCKAWGVKDLEIYILV